MIVIKVLRKDKSEVYVRISYDRNTGKYCFINLTKNHVCKCRFNTVDEAIEDMRNSPDVVSFKTIDLVTYEK